MKDRIKAIMDHLHLTQQIFSLQTGINAATLSGILSGKTNPSTNVLINIKKRYPQFSTDWLLFGYGEMLASSTSETTAAADGPQDAGALPQGGTVQTPTSQQSTTLNALHQEPQVVQGTEAAITGTAKVAVQPSVQTNLFDMPNVTQHPLPNTSHEAARAIASPNKNARASSQEAANIPPVMQVVSQPTQYVGRKITEIRVFYDDQTWESFVPKK